MFKNQRDEFGLLQTTLKIIILYTCILSDVNKLDG